MNQKLNSLEQIGTAESKRTTKTASFLYLLFFATFIGSRILDMPTLYANFLVALSGLLALCYCLCKFGLNHNHTIMIIAGAMFTVFMLFSVLCNGNADILDVLWIWAYMGIGALLYEFKIPERIHSFCVYSFMAIILFHIFKGKAPMELLSIGSENNISVYLIFSILAGYLSQLNEEKPLKYLSPFLCFLLCLWTGSRGGVLTSIVLIVFVFGFNFLSIEKGKLSTLLKIALLVALTIWVIDNFWGEYISAFVQKTDRYGAESIRTHIWEEYVHATFDNLSNFLFGVDSRSYDYKLLHYHNGNAHNSFLILHSKFGLAGFLSLIVLIFNVFSKAARKKTPKILLIMIVAGTRMMFDWCAFPGLLDVLFWYMLLYVTELDQKRFPQNKVQNKFI